MTCKLINDIKHSCEYNSGGIKEILLLDINDFDSYRFADDRLYDECVVDAVHVHSLNYVSLDVVGESQFAESAENSIFKQELTTYVRSLEGTKTRDLLLASVGKYLVLFQTHEGRIFSFGSDGGASLSFSQQSGQLGEGSGYEIILQKQSIYPLFETEKKLRITGLLSTENLNYLLTEENSTVWVEK